MMEFNYKTRKDSSPRGKARVYFSCHPKDFDATFELISEDVLNHANCTIWYDPSPETEYNPKELRDNLGEMQLMVFAVTSRFIYQWSRARDMELRFALEKHIPILPILLEKGIAHEFSKICASVQVVNRYVTDPTATPYDEVLDKFINSVLAGDDLYEKVRDAFDAYVFLSYRKKDRAHAQRLMRLIHENPQFRDIAIWYDEFLIPGESFNDAIKDAFEKSGLFALAVTENVLEPKNYVMRVEYPMATDRKKEKDDLEIIPVELYEDGPDRVPLDREQMETDYREIPEILDEHEKEKVSSTFASALEKIGRKEKDTSARHRFFIGIAYLCGIDTDINPNRGIELISSAATDYTIQEGPCIEATEKMVSIYRNGEGTAADFHEAIKWQDRLVQQCREEYAKNYSPDEHRGFGTKTFKALLELSDMEREIGDERCLDDAFAALELCNGLEAEVGIRESDRDRALAYNRIGGIYLEKNQILQAKEYYIKALKSYERLSEEIKTFRAWYDLSIANEKLGNICYHEDDMNSAWEYYSKAFEIRKELVEKKQTPAIRRAYSAILTKLGNIKKAQKDYEEAHKYYTGALEEDLKLSGEFRTDQAYDDVMVSFVKYADNIKAQGNLLGSLYNYIEAKDVFEEELSGTASVNILEHYATAVERTAGVNKKLGEKEAAKENYLLAIELRRDIAEAFPSCSTKHNLAAAIFNRGLFLKNSDLIKDALDIWEELCMSHPEYLKFRNKAKETIEKLSL